MDIPGTYGPHPDRLTNRYYCMRHGRSLANEAGLIISNPEEGTSNWGLADGTGEDIRRNAENSGLGAETLILTSPFLRASETADLAAEVLGADSPVADPRLRERWFGEWDGGSHERYATVWTEDRRNTLHGLWGVESVADVLKRLRNLVGQMEEVYSGRTILLVSHGDPTDILITWANGNDLEKHMDVKMGTAEIRPLVHDSAS